MKPGSYCLNIPDEMYEKVKELLGECSEKISMTSHKRRNGYSEYIYAWKKE
jgi:hypothetical protein